MIDPHASVLIILMLMLNCVEFQKINLETINNYSEFLNYGDKKSWKLGGQTLENSVFKSKVDVLGEIFKIKIDDLKSWGKLDIIFLIDASSSVGEKNFRSELKFVRKLLSDVVIDYNHTRIGLITFSSEGKVIKNIDEISVPRRENNKCLLLNKQLNSVNYTGGSTYTIGAFLLAKEIFNNSRNDSKKVMFLITDGFSNGGDPVPVATELKKQKVTIFTIGIQNGNYIELYKLSSSPGELHSYLLDSFEEFESIARRALHVDLKMGDYIELGINSPCDHLCDKGNCCDADAVCTCGTSTGHYSCICKPGYYGTGLEGSCSLCPRGLYSDGPNMCTPCPDIYQTTVPPASGIGSCKCKLGYQHSNKTKQCEILNCKVLAEPEHGYFVNKKECGVVLNSACGVRCEVGYTLVGSSIRLCQANGTWRGDQASCQVKTCSKLNAPVHGTMKCTQPDLNITYSDADTNLPVDAVCSFRCGKGKTIIGSRERTCLPLAMWDGLKTSCKQIKCSKLVPPPDGEITPESCKIGRQSYGKNCTYSCKKGFEIVGPVSKFCTGNHGLWSTKFENTYCKDVEPPAVSCPRSLIGFTNLGANYGHVTWSELNVTDNSDMEITMWTVPPIYNMSTFMFKIGRTVVTFYAQDASQNRVKCRISVIIKDVERPQIENCISPPPFLTTNKEGANVSWDEPHIFDNSQHVKISKSHHFGFFKTGVTPITYIATDSSGNKNMCQINITIEAAKCDPLPDPYYGQAQCIPKNEGMQCVITCQDGYAVPFNQPYLPTDATSMSATNLTCNTIDIDSAWYNEDELIYPECSVTELPKEVMKEGTAIIDSDVEHCRNLEKLRELGNEVEEILKNIICTDNCTINTKPECMNEEMKENQEELTNIIKRDLEHALAPHRNKTKKRGRSRKVNVHFQIRGDYNHYTAHVKDLKFQNTSIKFENFHFICSIGFIPRKNRCVQCPKGTFVNVTSNKCQSCAVGLYNNRLGQTKCKPCPPHYSTKKSRSRNITDCKEKCPPGTHARKKTVRHTKRQHTTTLSPICKSCAIGHYQSDYGQLKCIPCPNGYTTTSFGSKTVKECIPTAENICLTVPFACNTGKCIVLDEYHYGCSCLKNYIGSSCEKKMDSCDSNPCTNGGACMVINTTHSYSDYQCICKNNFSGRFCEEIVEECNLKCNTGKCIEYDDNKYMCYCPEGYGGENCEIRVNYCNGSVCENNGTCIEENWGFRCQCSGGFIGRRCNILPCDYRPCKENVTCTNVIDEKTTINSYRCECPPGSSGTFCEKEDNFCSEHLCVNNGTCISKKDGFECICLKRFFGKNCQHKYNTKYVLHFEKSHTTDYVKLDGFTEDLSQISVCLWLQTTDSFNYGTLVSYANKEFDNAFTLTDYTGIVLYVNKKYVTTDVYLNDGQWHHICTTWRSLGGIYNVYVDGKLRKNGTGLAHGTRIKGRGNLILGQEQDILGGRFSQSESFIGKMTYIDIWSEELREEDILLHFIDCEDSFIGNSYSWPEIQRYIHGGVKIQKSSFCNKCPELQSIPNGSINVTSEIAYYGCNDGFKMTNLYKNGRKCTKASKWEGSDEPYCRRIYCGYPGYIKNGYTLGSSFYFEDQVHYQCQEGYNLIGNKTLTCMKNGNWDPVLPQCVGLQCKAFAKPRNSNVTVLSEYGRESFTENESIFDIGTQIEVGCLQDATLMGESVITCLDNGSWDYDPPTCAKATEAPTTTTKKSVEPACSLDHLPAPPPNSYTLPESIRAFEEKLVRVVNYSCNAGYRTVGENHTTCIIDGYWTEPKFTCKPNMCNKPPISMNMVNKEELDDSNLRIGSTLYFVCADGHRLVGNNKIRCLPSMKWSRLQGKCRRISCRKPSVTEEAIIVGNSYLYEDLVTITCPDQIKYVLKCNKFGKWEGSGNSSC